MAVLYILAALILAKWFSILREPGEILSFYNRMLIPLDEGNMLDQAIYKTLTCSLCHSGYLAIYFIFAYNQHLMILPITMVAYYLLSKIKFQ